MSIRARLFALLACFALMAATLTGLGLMTIKDYNVILQSYEDAHENAMRGERLNYLISNVVMETRGQYIARTPEEQTTFTNQLIVNLDQIDSLLVEWKADLGPTENLSYQPLFSGAANFIKLRREVATLAKDGKLAEAEKLSTENRPTRIEIQNQIKVMVSDINKDLEAKKAAFQAYHKNRSGQFLIAALVSILTISILTYWVVRNFISLPLKAIAAAIINTAKGDYAADIKPTHEKDEISLVWNALAVLKSRAQEAERLAKIEREMERQKELKLREIMLD